MDLSGVTDKDRIKRLEGEVSELKEKVERLLLYLGLRDGTLEDFRERTTIPAPPSGV